jgi:transcriptional regulator with XRE-family HTH domain
MMSITRDEIRAARKREGWTQQALADHLGVRLVTVARWECGTHTIQPWHAWAIRELAEGRPVPWL